VGAVGLRVAASEPVPATVVVAAGTVVVVEVVLLLVVVVALGTVVVVAGTVVVVVVVVADGVPDTVHVSPDGASFESTANVISTFQNLSISAPAALLQAMPTLYFPASTKPGANSVEVKLKPGSVGTGPGPPAVAAMLVVTLT
jgi:hypothetical protein